MSRQQTQKLERRTFPLAEIRADEGDGKRTIVGHAAVFDKLSVDFGGWQEKIARGAFKESLDKDVYALWAHSWKDVLGRTHESGSLKISEDEVGLRFSLEMPDTQLGRDTFELIRRRDVSGMSFGFYVRRATWQFDEDEAKPDIRTLELVELFEISPTPFPAYPDTDVNVRSMAEIFAEGRSILAERDQARLQQQGKLKFRRLELAKVAA